MIQVARVRRFLRNSAWAILPNKLAEISEFIDAHAAGERLTREEIVERIGAAPRRPSQSVGAVAVIPILGVITQRANIMSEISGGTSSQMTAKAIRAAVADDTVRSIVLEIDSPGGEVYGTAELADVIFEARRSKYVMAVANSLAASAAYWIGSQASEFVVTPSGEVGSIGVVAVHQEDSKRAEAAGVTTTVVRAGANKWLTNEFEPLSAAGRASLQERVDEAHALFINAVARGRRVSQATARNNYGQGLLVGAAEALRLGMIDTIETFDAALARAMSAPQKNRAASALETGSELLAASTVETVATNEQGRSRPVALLRRELELL